MLFEMSNDLELDIQASKSTSRVTLCSECNQVLDGVFAPKQYCPNMQTWSGLDLFQLRRPRLGRHMLFCSVRFIEVARTEKWQGLRFDAIDVNRELALGGSGIDYLARKWPPKSWYPDPPSAGKTAEEWLAIYNTEKDGGRWYEAWRALLYLGQEAVPAVLRQFESTDEVQKMHAARLIGALGKHGGVDLSEEVVEEARALWPDPDVHP
jgi:hypothetical protein